MKALIALLILGSIATSASAAGTDMHLLTPAFSSHQEHPTLSRSTIDGTFSRFRYFGRGAAGFGHQQ
jgi:hypothetical protein